MEDDIRLGIQPCCIARKLPGLIRQGGATTYFFSHGDWGVGKLIDAISSLVPSKFVYGQANCPQSGKANSIASSQAFVMLSLPTVDAYTLAHLRSYLHRYWIQALALIIADTGKETLVRTALNGYGERLWYCEGRAEAATQNIFYRTNSEHSLFISGPLYIGEGSGRFSQYCATLDKPEAVLPLMSYYKRLMRLHASMRGSDELFGTHIIN